MDNGQEYYQELLQIFKDLKSSDVWKTLQDNWKLYQKKHYNRGDIQDEDSKDQEEECEDSNKNNRKKDMGDGEESDDIEEATSDDEGQSPRARAKLG
jgi:hypothetical protein